jgi:hypothetical protein
MFDEYGDLRNRIWPNQVVDPASVRDLADLKATLWDVGTILLDRYPASRERSLALTALEQVAQWATAAAAPKGVAQ